MSSCMRAHKHFETNGWEGGPGWVPASLLKPSTCAYPQIEFEREVWILLVVLTCSSRTVGPESYPDSDSLRRLPSTGETSQLVKHLYYAQNPSTTGSPPSTPNALGDNRLLVCLVPDPACKNFKRFGDPCAGVLSASIACLRQLDGYCRGMSKTDQQ